MEKAKKMATAFKSIFDVAEEKGMEKGMEKRHGYRRSFSQEKRARKEPPIHHKVY